MEIIAKTLLFLHVSFGFTSLALFWLPVFLKKGGKGHIISGKLYVIAMWVVVISAALLSVKNVIIGKYFIAAFLGFIALITANPLWYGMAVLRPKAQSKKRFQLIHITLDGLVSICGLGLLIWGIYLGGNGNAVLMLIFGGLGCTVFPSFLKKLLKPYQESDRMKEHVVGLLTSGVAAYSAFFVFGGYTWMEKILPGMWQVLPWVAPGVIGGVGITLTVKYFRKKGLIAQR